MKEMKKFLCKFSKLPYVDLVAGVRCGHPHVLAGVVATDGGRVGEPGAGDGQGVSLLGRIFYRDSHLHCNCIALNCLQSLRYVKAGKIYTPDSPR